MAPTAPGEVAEMDFEKLGTLINPITCKRQVVYGLLVVLWNLFSRGFPQRCLWIRRESEVG
jgi:hypothetical protein